MNVELNEEEIWEVIPIKKYKTYEISNHGRCRNKDKGNILKQNLVSKYYMTSLNYKGESKKIVTHRLVAMAFIPNDNPDYDVVNHKDGNKFNNKASNLEWTDHKGNVQHAIKVLNRKKSNKAVIRIDSEGLETMFESMTIAGEEHGVTRESIRDAVRGRSKTSAGYKWKYYDEKYARKEIDLSDYIKLEDYENYYISKEGNVYSKNKNQFLTHNLMDGYPKVMLYNDSKPKCEYVHKLVALYFVLNPDPENKTYVNHINNDIKYPHFYNLEWVTKREIQQHSKFIKNKSIVLNELLKKIHGSGENSEVKA